jgi:hypothetical protein
MQPKEAALIFALVILSPVVIGITVGLVRSTVAYFRA